MRVEKIKGGCVSILIIDVIFRLNIYFEDLINIILKTIKFTK